MIKYLPYVALGITTVVMLFGNDLVGNSATKDSEVLVALAVLEQAAEYARERDVEQSILIKGIITTQKEQGEVINESRKQIAVLSNTIKHNGLFVSSLGY